MAHKETQTSASRPKESEPPPKKKEAKPSALQLPLSNNATFNQQLIEGTLRSELAAAQREAAAANSRGQAMVQMVARELEVLRDRCDETESVAARERQKVLATTTLQLHELKEQLILQSSAQIRELQGLVSLRDKQLSRVVGQQQSRGSLVFDPTMVLPAAAPEPPPAQARVGGEPHAARLAASRQKS